LFLIECARELWSFFQIDIPHIVALLPFEIILVSHHSWPKLSASKRVGGPASGAIPKFGWIIICCHGIVDSVGSSLLRQRRKGKDTSFDGLVVRVVCAFPPLVIACWMNRTVIAGGHI